MRGGGVILCELLTLWQKLECIGVPLDRGNETEEGCHDAPRRVSWRRATVAGTVDGTTAIVGWSVGPLGSVLFYLNYEVNFFTL